MTTYLTNFRATNCCGVLTNPDWHIKKSVLINNACASNVEVKIPPCTDIKATYKVNVTKDINYKLCTTFLLHFDSNKDALGPYNFKVKALANKNHTIVVENTGKLQKIVKGRNCVQLCGCITLSKENINNITNDEDNIEFIFDQNVTVYPLLNTGKLSLECSCKIIISADNNICENPSEVCVKEKVICCDKEIDIPLHVFPKPLTASGVEIYNYIYKNDFCGDICNKKIINKVSLVGHSSDQGLCSCIIDRDSASINIKCCDFTLDVTPSTVICQEKWSVKKTADNEKVCSLSPGYWKTHGPTGDSTKCINCHQGNNSNTWPLFDGTILGTTVPLTKTDLCFLLNLSSGNDAPVQCNNYKLANLLFQWVATFLNKANGVNISPVQSTFDLATALLKNYVTKPNANLVTVSKTVSAADIIKSKEYGAILDNYIKQTECVDQTFKRKCVEYIVELTPEKDSEIIIKDGKICFEFLNDCCISGDGLKFILKVYDYNNNLLFSVPITVGTCITNLVNFFKTNNVDLSKYLGKKFILQVVMKHALYDVNENKFIECTHNSTECEVANACLEIPECHDCPAVFCDKFIYDSLQLGCSTCVAKLVPILTGTTQENNLVVELTNKFNYDGKVLNGEKRCINLPLLNECKSILKLRYMLCFTDCCAKTTDGKIKITNCATVGKKDINNLCSYENACTTISELYIGKCGI